MCGPFNSAIVRLARERANALLADGKQVKIFCVGRKGFEQLRRLYESRIIDTVDLRAVRQIKFEQCRRDRRSKIVALFNAGQFDVCTLFFSRFNSVIAQIPTAQQLIPAVFPASAASEAAARSTNTSPTRRTSSPSSCRATSRCRSSARCWRTPPPSTAPR